MILFVLNSFAQQIGFEEIDDSKVHQWLPKTTYEYQSVYHFGDSEMEVALAIFVVGNQWYAQLKSGDWAEDGKSWIAHYENLKNVRIEGNKFYSDKTNGEFVIYQNGGDKIVGLKVYQSLSGIAEKGVYEIGTKAYPITHYFLGKYSEASYQKLSKEQLMKFSKSELSIMRNEIFARYGYQFRVGGKMNAYFKKQDWYQSQHQNVDIFLTEIEKQNIQLIREVEKNK